MGVAGLDETKPVTHTRPGHRYGYRCVPAPTDRRVTRATLLPLTGVRVCGMGVGVGEGMGAGPLWVELVREEWNL